MRRTGKRIIVAVLAVALLAGCLTRSASAGPSPHMVTGRWTGFFRSIDDSNIRGLTVEISSQKGRRFAGEIRGMVIDGGIPVDGTISESGEVTLTGRSSDVKSLVIHGATELDERGIAPCVLVGRYTLQRADGTRDHGDLVAVQQVPDADAPSFAGGWQGSAIIDGSETPVDVSLSQDRAGAIGGVASWGARCTGDGSVCPSEAFRTFNLVGQAFGETSCTGVELVGRADDALIAITMVTDGCRTGGPGELAGSYVMVKEVDPAPARPSAERGSITLLPAIQQDNAPA